MSHKRELFRVALDRRGELQRDGEKVPCHLMDVTEQGFRLTTELTVAVHERLLLRFSLTEDAGVECTIEVVFARPPQVGARIITMAPDHRERLSRFLEQLNGLNLTGF